MDPQTPFAMVPHISLLRRKNILPSTGKHSSDDNDCVGFKHNGSQRGLEVNWCLCFLGHRCWNVFESFVWDILLQITWSGRQHAQRWLECQTFQWINEEVDTIKTWRYFVVSVLKLGRNCLVVLQWGSMVTRSVSMQFFIWEPLCLPVDLSSEYFRNWKLVGFILDYVPFSANLLRASAAIIPELPQLDQKFWRSCLWSSDELFKKGEDFLWTP